MVESLRLLESSYEISMLEKVEICGLLGGEKSVMRICRNVSDVQKLTDTLERLNLKITVSGTKFIKENEQSSGQVYGFAMPANFQMRGGLDVFYVTRPGDGHLAEELIHLELRDGCNVAIGD